MLVFRSPEPVTDPGAPLQVLPPVEAPANHYVEGNWQGDWREADGQKHLNGTAIWRREIHSSSSGVYGHD
jgi:hypothetical protein